MNKRILCMVLMISILSSLIIIFPIDGYAASEGSCGYNLTWLLDDQGTLTINGSGNMTNWVSYSSVPWYSSRTNIKNVVIGNNVTSISYCAFYKCTALRSVVIGNSVTSIGAHAFDGCIGLRNVVIPDSVTSIGVYAFDDCSSLIKVDITDIKAWCDIEFEAAANPLSYANNLYLNDVLVTNLIIPDSVTSIVDYVFNGCTSLTSVEIPDNVTSIGGHAFEGCTGLTSVEIPDNVTSIGSCAFNGCTGLTSVEIPNSVTSIGDCAFEGCTNFTSVTIGNGMEIIPERAFMSCRKLKYVCLPAEILYIRNDAFNFCSDIETVFYAGRESKWNEIMFYNRNENLTNAKIVCDVTKKIYKFETNCDATLEDITDYAIFSMPDVENDGMTLLGWYDNESLSGIPVIFPYYGSATTLYAAWTDRTGKSFEDAFITKANQEYTVTTTENGQYVYFEFVPNLSKEYRFYTTENKDIYGYLYDSNQSRLASDDGGNGNNFYISYNLTAGQTYYIAAKLYSGTGTFTFVVEEPVDYRINSVTIKDMLGNSLQSIPTGTFLATVSFTNVSSNADTVIILVQYTDEGAFKGLMYIQTEDVPTGSTIKLSIPVDNSKGDVAKLKAFCWESFGSVKPMGNSASFPTE